MDNIAIVSDFYDIQFKKNAGTPALRLIVEALAKKYKVHIIAPDGEAVSNGNIYYHRIPGCKVFSSGLVNGIYKKLYWYTFYCNATVKLLELNKKYDFKLIYGAGCNSVYVASEFANRFNIPSVGRLFGTYLYPHLSNPITLLTKFEEVKAFKSNCTAFIITNDGTGGDLVAKYFGVWNGKVFFWRNGVERPLDKTEYSDKEIRLISMARLEKWKRVDRIITAFSKSISYEPKLVLDIVGDGPELNNLKELVHSYGLDSKVRFCGELPRDQALDMLTQSDIFITTNDYSNISNSLMEAMSAGKAVIALNTGQTSSMLNGLNGLVVEEDELHRAINQLCNKYIRAFTGYKAKLYAAENFESWDSRIQKEVAVCDGLVGRKP